MFKLMMLLTCVFLSLFDKRNTTVSVMHPMFIVALMLPFNAV